VGGSEGSRGGGGVGVDRLVACLGQTRGWLVRVMNSGVCVYIYTIHEYTVIRQNSLICKITIQIRSTIQNNMHD
jgi:hypothetical protein